MILETENGAPGWTIATILFVILFAWIMAGTTSVISLGVAKQCDLGYAKNFSFVLAAKYRSYATRS
jgi:hypothetical protein